MEAVRSTEPSVFTYRSLLYLNSEDDANLYLPENVSLNVSFCSKFGAFFILKLLQDILF